MVERINQATAGVKSIDCRFTQVKRLAALTEPQTSAGRMLFDGSARFRWEYIQPYPHTFIINNDKVYIRSEKVQQTIDIGRSRLFKLISQLMLSSVSGTVLGNATDFDCALYIAGDEWQAVLTPKRRELKKLMKGVRLHFNSARGMVTKAEMAEPRGDTTVITLKDVKTNVKIDERMWR